MIFSFFGSFEILFIENWDNPTPNLVSQKFIIDDNTTDVLYIPKGYVGSIQSMKKESKLLIMSNYKMNEVDDNFSYSIDCFKK